MSGADFLRCTARRTFPRGAVRLTVAATLVTVFAISGEARSYCRTITRAPPAGWNIVAHGCFADTTGGAKAVFWRNSCVGYSLHKNASKLVSLEQATQVVDAAFASWTSSSCAQGGRPSVSAVNLGPVDCGKAGYNDEGGNQNVIMFHDEVWPHAAADKTLGLTTLTFDTMTGELVGADMEINATQNLVVGDAVPPGSYSLASVITHEVGHFWGLGHSAEASAIMFAEYKPAALLAGDDVEGLCAIYGPDGSRTTTDGPVAGARCDPTPRGGFISACSAPPGTSDPGTAESGGCSLARTSTSRRWIGGGAGAVVLSLFVVRRRCASSKAARLRGGARLAAGGVLLAALLFGKEARANVSCAVEGPATADVTSQPRLV